MKLVVFGLTISSSWGNGHATLWRGLCRALAAPRPQRRVLRARRALLCRRTATSSRCRAASSCCTQDWDDIRRKAQRAWSPKPMSRWSPRTAPTASTATGLVLDAPRAVRVFYDLDTPVTLSRLDRGESLSYIGPRGLRDFDLVLSYTGGGRPRPAPCAGSARAGSRRSTGTSTRTIHRPMAARPDFAADLSYLGTYAADRQAALEALFIEPARRRPDRRFLIGGAQYPRRLSLDGEHLLRPPPAAGRAPGLLLVLPPDAQRHPPGDGRDGLVSVRAAVRGGGLRRRDADRCLGGARRLLRARPRDPRRRAPTAGTTRGARSAAIASCARSARPARERALSEHTSDRRAATLEAAIEAARSRAGPAQALPMEA